MIAVLTYWGLRKGRVPQGRVGAFLDRIQVDVEVFSERRESYQEAELGGLRVLRAELGLALQALRPVQQPSVVTVVDRLGEYLDLGVGYSAQTDADRRHDQRRAEKRLSASIEAARRSLGLR
ncbi:hypothetical protein [Streptomyces sp. NPDC046182]|uniref:hypothetical protein n=1 Tax=Streptomyces sp. NPDC046182 TaxID=3154601 RepID=UPI00340543A2